MAKAFNAGERWKTTIGLISKKGTLHGQHTFFVHCFAVVLHDYTTSDLQKIPSYTFYGGSVVRVLVHYFWLPLIFTLHYWWPLAFLILSPLLQFFFKSPSPFFSLSFTGLPPTFSFCLSFSYSIFQICGHDNLSKLNTFDNADTEKNSAFRFRLYWLFFCLCFTRRRWLCDFPPKQPRVAFQLPYLLI